MAGGVARVRMLCTVALGLLLGACGGGQAATGPGESIATPDPVAEAPTDEAPAEADPTAAEAPTEAVPAEGGDDAAAGGGDFADACALFTEAQVSEAFGEELTVVADGATAGTCTYMVTGAFSVVTVSVTPSAGIDLASFRAAAEIICEEGTYVELDAGDGGYGCAAIGVPTAAALFGDSQVQIVAITGGDTAASIDAASALLSSL